MFKTQIWIEPHERQEAILTYSDLLSAEQISLIRDAEESALICLTSVAGAITSVTIVPEG